MACVMSVRAAYITYLKIEGDLVFFEQFLAASKVSVPANFRRSWHFISDVAFFDSTVHSTAIH